MSDNTNLTNSVHTYADVFQRMIQLSPQVRIEMINEMFKTDFPLDTPNELLDTKRVSQFLNQGDGDSLIGVMSGGKTEVYYVRCTAHIASDLGAMMFRSGYVLSYDGGLGTKLRFVHQAVLMTGYAPRLKDRIDFSLPSYDVDHPGAVVENKFSFRLYNLLKEGYEKTKHVTAFLPFQVGDVREQFRKAKGRTPELDILLKRRLQGMVQVVDSKVRCGILTEEAVLTLKELIAAYMGNQFARYYPQVGKEKMPEMVRTTMRLRLPSDELISYLHRAEKKRDELLREIADQDREIASLKQQMDEQAQEISDLKQQLKARTP